MRGRRSVGVLDLVGCMMRWKAWSVTPPAGRNFRPGSSPHGRGPLRRGRLRPRDDPRDRPGHDGQRPAWSSTTTAQLVGRAYREFEQHFPRPGLGRARRARDLGGRRAPWPCEALDDAGVPDGEPDARSASRTSARPSACGIRRPASRCTARSSGRTAAPPARCDELRAAGHEPLVRERTGLVLDPYFSATKIEWLLRDVDGLRRARARRARRLRHDRRLADLQPHAASTSTDPSNASRTLLYDLRTGRLGPTSCCELFGVPERALPEVRPSMRRARHDARRRAARPRRRARRRAWPATSRPRSTGRRASIPGLGKNTYGTGLVRAREHGRRAARRPPPGLLATVAWGIGRARGSSRSRRRSSSPAPRSSGCATASGSSTTRRETERARRRRWTANDGVYFVPALTGLGSPHWDPYARGDDRRAHARQRAARTSRARRWRRSPTRPSTPCARWRPRPGEPLAELQGGRRRDRQRVAHAVPGRRARRPGRRAGDRARRRRSGAALLAGVGAGVFTQAHVTRPLARGRALRAADGRRRARRRCSHGWARALERSPRVGRSA